MKRDPGNGNGVTTLLRQMNDPGVGGGTRPYFSIWKRARRPI
jgi:hypothetical protein